MKNRSVIITGAAGFIGSHLSKYFLEQGYLVLGIDNFCTGLKSNITELKDKYPQNFLFREADVAGPWKADWFLELNQKNSQVTHILHFASPASPPLYQKLWLETLRVNSVGVEEGLKLATMYGARFIFASTSEIYGDPEVHPQPESYRGSVSTLGPRACYDEAKRYGEALISTWNRNYRSYHGFVRIFNTYGPGMNPRDGRVVINLLTQATKNLPLTIYGDGQQTRSFCYVDDLVNGIVAYAFSDVTEPVNLGNDREFSILELANLVKEISGKPQLKIVHEELPTDDPKVRRPELTKSRELLPHWSGPKVPLRDGLEKLKVWLEESGLL